MSQKQIPEHQKIRMQEISLFIKNWRLNEGLSMREFAKLAGVHVNSIYNLEHQKSINFITLLNCIDAMNGMTITEFFTDME